MPRHRGQQRELLAARGRRQQQKKHQVDRFAIDRIEIDRPLQPRKQTERLRQFVEARVGNRDTVTDAGRAETLALQQPLGQQHLRTIDRLRRDRRQFTDELRPVGAAQPHDDVRREQNIHNNHSVSEWMLF